MPNRGGAVGGTHEHSHLEREYSRAALGFPSHSWARICNRRQKHLVSVRSITAGCRDFGLLPRSTGPAWSDPKNNKKKRTGMPMTSKRNMLSEVTAAGSRPKLAGHVGAEAVR